MPPLAVQRNASHPVDEGESDWPTITDPSSETPFASLRPPSTRLPRPTMPPLAVQRKASFAPATPTTVEPSAETASAWTSSPRAIRTGGAAPAGVARSKPNPSRKTRIDDPSHRQRNDASYCACTVSSTRTATTVPQPLLDTCLCPVRSRGSEGGRAPFVVRQ